MTIRYRAALIHRSIKEIVPRRAVDRANSGQLGLPWHQTYIPISSRARDWSYKSEQAAIQAAEKYAARLQNIGEFRALIWVAGNENLEATTVAM